MITLAPAERHLVREAERALMRRKLIDEWRLLPRLATALLDEWSAHAASRGLGDHGAAYWREAEPWLRAHARGEAAASRSDRAERPT